MVLTCKDKNQLISIQAYHHNLIKYKTTDTFFIITNNKNNVNNLNNVTEMINENKNITNNNNLNDTNDNNIKFIKTINLNKN
jgi:hypothetical protein